MFEALKAGLEREVIQYKIDEAPNRAGDLRQRATEIDAAALNYSCIDRIMFDFGRSTKHIGNAYKEGYSAQALVPMAGRAHMSGSSEAADRMVQRSLTLEGRYRDSNYLYKFLARLGAEEAKRRQITRHEKVFNAMLKK